MKALLLENVHPDAESVLRAAGVAVAAARGALDESGLARRSSGVDAARHPLEDPGHRGRPRGGARTCSR